MKRVSLFVCACLLCFSFPFRIFSRQQTAYDLLITGGRVLDGTGNPWFAADVAIKDGKIAAIGKIAGATARRTIIEEMKRFVAQGMDDGAWADVTVFDPTTIRDRATYVNPHQYAEGILFVFVNGEPVVDGGKITGKLAGKVLRR